MYGWRSLAIVIYVTPAGSRQSESLAVAQSQSPVHVRSAGRNAVDVPIRVIVKVVVPVAQKQPLGANVDRESIVLFFAAMLAGMVLAAREFPEQTFSLAWALLAGAILAWALRKRD